MSEALKLSNAPCGQEERLKLALACGGFGTWDWDLSTGQLVWDERMHELYGMQPKTFSGSYMDIIALLHPDDRGVLADQLMRIGESRESEAREVEFRILLPDGRERFLADRSEAILGTDGQIQRMIGITWDVTNRKQAELELEQARNEAEAANARMKRDLLAAARVQQSLLPERLPVLPGLSTAWLYRPCEELAGDALNLFAVDDRYLIAYVLDVCGHGVPSSLLAVSVMRNLGLGDGSVILSNDEQGVSDRLASPAQVCERLNRLYPMNNRSRLYFTILYGVLDTRDRAFRYTCAGNPGPVLVRPGSEAEHFNPSGFPIGLFPGVEYEESRITLNAGDRLYLSTDGIGEEHSRDEELFGWQRYSDVLQKLSHRPLDEGLDQVVDDAIAWCGKPDLRDDVAIVGLELR